MKSMVIEPSGSTQPSTPLITGKTNWNVQLESRPERGARFTESEDGSGIAWPPLGVNVKSMWKLYGTSTRCRLRLVEIAGDQTSLPFPAVTTITVPKPLKPLSQVAWMVTAPFAPIGAASAGVAPIPSMATTATPTMSVLILMFASFRCCDGTCQPG